MAASF
jgi:hypothetical protein